MLLIQKYLVICLFFSCNLLVAGEQSNKSAPLLVVTEQAFPFSYTENEDTAIKGLATSVIKGVLAFAHLDYELHIYPWARSYRIAQERPNVLIYSIARSPQREQKFKWIGELIQLTFNLYGRKSRQAELNVSDQDLRTMRIGVVKGDVTDQYLSSQGYTNLVRAEDYKHLNTLIANNRVDFILSSGLGMKYIIQRLHMKDQLFKGHHYPGLDVGLYLAASIGTDDATVNRLRSSYDLVIKGEAYQKLQNM